MHHLIILFLFSCHSTSSTKAEPWWARRPGGGHYAVPERDQRLAEEASPKEPGPGCADYQSAARHFDPVL